MGKWRYKKKSKLFLFRKREKPISILLGAGFSAPMGYPIGNQLNEIIFNCHSDSISFHSDGTLVVGDNSNAHLIQYNQYYDFCKDIIRYYNDNIKAFDYEEFYDYLKGKAKDDSGLKELFEKGSYNKSEFDDFEQYVYQIDNIYNQLVAFYLKDREGRSWYDDEPVCSKPTFNGYTGFLNCIEELSKNCIINVHTLNHDLFFERLDNTEWINGKLGDGFKDENSTLYGGLDDGTKIKLPVYTGKYDAKIRLYKLHGSIDQYVFYARQRQAVWVLPETYIKSKPEIAPYDFYKEVTDAEGKVTYENCGTNYHPDFLTGVTYKVSRYKEPLLYKKLFELFKKNLNKSEVLIIIGYGFKDTEINRLILEEYGNKKQCFIINPKFSQNIEDFIANMGTNTKLIKKQIEDIQLDDLQ